jgi:signal transduction histidine kinase
VQLAAVTGGTTGSFLNRVKTPSESYPLSEPAILPGEIDDGVPATGVDALLETVLEGLAQACLLVDGTDRILFCNDSAKSILMPKGRLLGRKLETVLADRQLTQLVAECFETRRPAARACALRLPGEAWRDDRHFIVEAMPLALANERWLVRLSLRPDEQADAAAKAVPNPAADVLVQLRGPLTVVQGYLENLLDGMITDPVALRQSLLTMRRSTIQIERILETLRQ